MRQLFTVPTILSLLSCLFLSISRGADRPNILLIVTDDHGYGDVSMNGGKQISTPAIDSIASAGIRFTKMRSTCTVCSPARAALMTGLYPDRVGVPGVIRTSPDDSWGFFDPNTKTIANFLGDFGYHTAMIGKWHLGLASPNLPNERGFKHFHGFLGDMMDSYYDHRRHGINYMRLNHETIDPQGHATELFAEWAVAYLESRKSEREPFFLYLAFNAPHFPIEPPADWLAKTKEKYGALDEKRLKNIALVEHLDHNIAKVLKKLAELELEKNTIVAFTSDNGGSLPHAQNNDPWRDGKQSHYDGGLCVPFAIRWPGRIEAGRVSDYEGLTFDLFPTFLEATHSSPAHQIDAVSLIPLLTGEGKMPEKRELYFVRREGGSNYGGKSYEAIIFGEWKLLQNDPYSPYELYNVRLDPSESEDVIQKHPQIVADLKRRLRKQIQRGGEVPWQAPKKVVQ